jgi:putative oxidoreductase
MGRNDVSTTQSVASLGWGARLHLAVDRAVQLLGRFPISITQLVLRITVALPFWRSGLTKWNGWFELSDGSLYMFEEEFKIHLFGQAYSYWPAQGWAYASGIAEILLPILLVLGLGTRIAALGILVMTGFIQLTIPEGWDPYHLPWAVMALAVMTHGPGKISVDHLLARGR